MESKVFIHCRCERNTCSSRRRFSTAMPNFCADVFEKFQFFARVIAVAGIASDSIPITDFLPCTGNSDDMMKAVFSPVVARGCDISESFIDGPVFFHNGSRAFSFEHAGFACPFGPSTVA